MKKLILILTIIITCTINCAYAQIECGCDKQTKCLDLMTSMYNERAALYNVLNLSADQQKCKDVIDKKRYEELGIEFKKYEQERFVLAKLCEHKASSQAIKKQEKVVADIEKYMKKISDKYDKEFKSVLNSEQKAKLKTIRKIEKKEIKQCQKNKPLFKKDANLRPFGEGFLYPQQDDNSRNRQRKRNPFCFKHNLNK